MVVPQGATSKAVTPCGSDGQWLGVEQCDGFLVELHILPEGNGRRLSPCDQMAQAPWLTCGVEFLHDGLMVFERMHLRKVIVAGDLRQPADEDRGIIAQ